MIEIKKGEISSYFELKGTGTISLDDFEEEERILSREISKLQEDGKLDNLYRLEYYLKGMRSFYHLGNHPRKTKDKWDLINETRIINSVINYIRRLYSETFEISQKRNFLNFVETKFRISLEYLLQREKEKSEWKLEGWLKSFEIRLREIEIILNSMSDLNGLGYKEFMTVGDLFLYNVVENPYVYPFIRRNFRVELHKVVHKKISDLIQNIKGKKKKYLIGISILQAFKILRILDNTGNKIDFSRNYFVFTYVKEELRKLKDFTIVKSSDKLKNMIDETISKTYDVLLANIVFDRKKISSFEKAKKLILNLLEDIVYEILVTVEEEIDIKDIFPGYKTFIMHRSELMDSFLRLEQLSDKSLSGDVEKYKKDLLNELKNFEDSYLLYIRLKYWEKFYHIFYGIKHSPHKFPVMRRIRELKSFISTVKKEVMEA